MIYDWYKIFNLAEFNNLGLVSRELTLDLEGLGPKSLRITKGNYTSILYNDVFLPVEMIDANPFEFDGHAVYVDDNDDVFLGIAVPDED